MKENFRDRIKKGVLVFDGGMATMLYDRGVFFNRSFEEVNVSQPDLVRAIHEEYIRAGAEVIETNSFGANRFKLARYGLEDRVAELNEKAVGIAREAAGDEIYVAGSVGPIGARIEPIGVMKKSEAKALYREQLDALLKAGVDLLVFETFKSIDDLVLAVDAARELSTDIPIQAMFTVGPDSNTEEGIPAQKAAVLLNNHPGVDILGINCSIGPASSLDVLLTFREHVSKPIAVMPNAGLPREHEGRVFYLATSEYMAEYAKQFLEAGASVIGGCCGTTPSHIREISRTVKTFDRGRRNITVKEVKQETKEKQQIPLEERSALGKKLKNREWITAVELVPPQGTSLDPVIKKTRELEAADVSVINIPDGPRASSRISTMITAIEMERLTKVETVMHYCCRDRNLIGMQGDLLGAHAVGLRNLLIVTGDPPKVGGYPDVSGVFDVDSIGLTRLVNRLNHGIDLGGNELPSTTSFVKGVGANPVATAIDKEIERTFLKAGAGADFIITQPVFDIDAFLSFIKAIEKLKLPVIAGVWPLASFRNAVFLQNEVPGVVIPDSLMRRMEKTSDKEAARREGVLIAREMIAEMKSVIAGVQVSPPFGRVQTALAVVAETDDEMEELVR
ncbi:MAG: bifunctional homocysteine S-methyltransferase/methylenetetrahydrofolate reductase [Spirochaetales bacterium]|nr:bifunctional homocysteine S-methyltransferase/methylenetetrahydrofolate reductase [Spirochaetales bacterium]